MSESTMDEHLPRPEQRATRAAWRHPSLLIPAFILLIAVAIQGMQLYREAPHPRAIHLAQVVPEQGAGWRSRVLPLGANEFLTNEAEKVLNYDDVLYREYSRGGASFELYIAYWGAGKMPTRFVANHTPDRCWSDNGWQCLQMKFRQPESLVDSPLKPAEWRIFEPPSGGRPTYVLYWHLVEGRLYNYGSRFNRLPSPLLWWEDAVQQVVLGSREQYFIRLTSEQPLEALLKDPSVAKILGQLGNFGLMAAAPAPVPSS